MRRKCYLWTIQGTPEQCSIVEDGLRQVTFPFAKLKGKIPEPLILWKDLSGFREGQKTQPIGEILTRVPRHLGGVHEASAGLFRIATGKINLDLSLSVASAQTCTVYEMAHLVDYMLPLTPKMRRQLSDLMHGGFDPKARWWNNWWKNPKQSYYDQDGEAWMSLFALAYSPFPYGWPDMSLNPDMAAEVHRILKVDPVRRVPQLDIGFLKNNP